MNLRCACVPKQVLQIQEDRSKQYSLLSVDVAPEFLIRAVSALCRAIHLPWLSAGQY